MRRNDGVKLAREARLKKRSCPTRQLESTFPTLHKQQRTRLVTPVVFLSDCCYGPTRKSGSCNCRNRGGGAGIQLGWMNSAARPLRLNRRGRRLLSSYCLFVANKKGTKQAGHGTGRDSLVALSIFVLSVLCSKPNPQRLHKARKERLAPWTRVPHVLLTTICLNRFHNLGQKMINHDK